VARSSASGQERGVQAVSASKSMNVAVAWSKGLKIEAFARREVPVSIPALVGQPAVGRLQPAGVDLRIVDPESALGRTARRKLIASAVLSQDA
jgi:hypothetical protein